jgi:tight adherence protein B
MREIVLTCFFAVCFLLAVWMFYRFILLDRRVERRINFYFDIVKGSKNLYKRKINLKDGNILRRINEALRNKLSASNQHEIELMLKSAGIGLNPEEYIMARWVLAALLGGILYLIFNNLILLIPGGAAGYIFPKIWLKKKIKTRIQKFNEGLPDMLSTIIGSLKSGYSFSQAFKTVVEECDEPVKSEIGILLKELNYGITMEDALNNLNSRMPSGDLELMIQAVLIQRQVGGNLAGVLEIIVGTIRERNKIQRQVQTLTSQGRLSGRVIGALPVVLGIMIYLVNPEYINVLFTNVIGKIIISVGVVSGIIGFILINKLTKIEV